MRTPSKAVSPATSLRPRTPGVILLFHDLRISISLLVRLTKRLFCRSF